MRSGDHFHLIPELTLGFAMVDAVGYAGFYVTGMRNIQGGWVGEILISLEVMGYGRLASK